MTGEIPKRRAPNPKALREDLAKRKEAAEAAGWKFSRARESATGAMVWTAEISGHGEPFSITGYVELQNLLVEIEKMRQIEEKFSPSQNGSKPTIQTDEIQLIPVRKIEPSPFEPQARRRARFKPEELYNLADSIVKHGLRQPILVRPISVLDVKRAEYEIVFGERRFLAAKAKGIESIKCFVENLSDAEVIELQYEENHRRQENDPLDDAFTFKFLMETHGYSEEQLADRFATNRRNVKDKLRLNYLIPEALAELAEGALPLKHAYYLAKFPPDVQKVIVEEQYAYKWQDKDDGAAPFDDFKDEVEENIIRALANAPFDPEDTRLHIKGLKCSDCTERSGYEPMLFPDLKEGDSCLNKACFDLKTNTHLKLTRIEIAEKLPNPKNLPVEEIAKKVPLVTDRSWTDEAPLGEKLLTKQTFYEAPECEHSTAAVVADGERKGQQTYICNNGHCKVHSGKSEPSANGSGKSEWQLQNLEREFNVKVKEKVREKIFRSCIEYFDDVRSFWAIADLVERLLVEMWFYCGYDTRKFVVSIIRDWKDLPSNQNREETHKFIAGLDKRRRSQLLFLLTFKTEGYYWNDSQDGVKKLAASYTDLKYDLLDAETRLELAPDEFKLAAGEYLSKIKHGENPPIPHFWWTEPAGDEPDENALGDASQG